MAEVRTYEVVVIGGGPAGATAAAKLALAGHRVALVERELEPGYQVGESLLPFCYPTLERTGMLERVKAAGFVRKHSVQFVSPRGNMARPYYFEDELDHELAVTWQVDRQHFDRMLLDNAREVGADVLVGTEALRTLRDEAGAVVGVAAQGPGGQALELRAPLVIDASGRDGFTMRERRWRVRETALDRIAVWTYFEGAERDPGRAAGATTIAYLPDGGWFWLIPLSDGRLSAGVVARASELGGAGLDPEAAYAQQRTLNPWVQARLDSGRRTGPMHTTRNFSYRARHCAADGLLLAGDAFVFLDPVFSSGIFIALTSGEAAACAAERALATGRFDAPSFAPYGTWLREQIEPMRQLIYAFYDPDFSFGELIRRHPELTGDITNILIGNLDSDFTRLFDAMAELVTLPAPLDFGLPAPASEAAPLVGPGATSTPQL